MLSKIEEQYTKYNEIFNDLDNLFLDTDKTARVLLENSLYLSVFTVFEGFLKELIDNYIETISEKDIKFTQLSEGIACLYFLEYEKNIERIFNHSGEPQIDAFRHYFGRVKASIPSKELKKHIRFEFLHESKLNGYYKDLFDQIIGERNFLTELKIEQSHEFETFFKMEIEWDAYTFLREFTKKVRNNIAHQNQEFKIDGFSSFESITNTFLFIIRELINRYEKYNEVKLTEYSENIMAQF